MDNILYILCVCNTAYEGTVLLSYRKNKGDKVSKAKCGWCNQTCE